MTMMAMMTEIIRCDVAGHGSQCFFWKVEFRNSNNLLLLLLSAISMALLPSSRTPIFTRVGAGSEEKKKKVFFCPAFFFALFLSIFEDDGPGTLAASHDQR